MKVKYIGDADTLALERDKVYDVISVEKGWLRVMTELDEDYLFPPEIFEVVEENSKYSLERAGEGEYNTDKLRLCVEEKASEIHN